MSKLGDMVLLGQRVSIAAKEEASRYDLPQIDVDHLLLALLVGGGPAGDLLRNQGLTLADARRATEKVRADHIARLGLVPPAAAPRPIRDPARGEIDWTRRALSVVKSNGDGGELGLLEELLTEPSGLVTEMLAEAGVDPDALRPALAERRTAAGKAPVIAPSDPDWPGVTHTGFVPAPAGEVWALVSDPARRPEWDETVGTVQPVGPDVWETIAATSGPDGKPFRIHPDHRRTHQRVIAFVPEEVVEWEVESPDGRDPSSTRLRLGIHLRPAAGGTTLVLTLGWPRRRGWRGLRQTLLHPIARAVATLTLFHRIAAISRALR